MLFCVGYLFNLIMMFLSLISRENPNSISEDSKYFTLRGYVSIHPHRNLLFKSSQNSLGNLVFHRLVGLVVSVSDYWSRGRGFDPRHFPQILNVD